MQQKLLCALLFTISAALLQGCHLPGATTGTGSSPSVQSRPVMTDTEFAKSAFMALAKGEQSVGDEIDWENFQVATENVGSKYTAFSDEPNRAAFRKAFITSFSSSFHGSGADETTLKNWKLDSGNATQSVVSAETMKQSHVRITLSKKDGVQKMSGIAIGQ